MRRKTRDARLIGVIVLQQHRFRRLHIPDIQPTVLRPMGHRIDLSAAVRVEQICLHKISLLHTERITDSQW